MRWEFRTFGFLSRLFGREFSFGIFSRYVKKKLKNVNNDDARIYGKIFMKYWMGLKRMIIQDLRNLLLEILLVLSGFLCFGKVDTKSIDSLKCRVYMFKSLGNLERNCKIFKQFSLYFLDFLRDFHIFNVSAKKTDCRNQI